VSVSPETQSRLKIIFIGTYGNYSLVSLKTLMSRYEIVGIIESAPREINTTHKPVFETIFDFFDNVTSKPSLSSIAHRNRIPFFYLTSASSKDLVNFIDACQADLGCIASMNRLLPEGAINLPRYGFINLHPAILPDYRGPNVWFWLYHELEPVGGMTIHKVDKGEDTGDILHQASFPISLGMPPQVLMNKSISLGSQILIDTIESLVFDRSVPLVQHHLACTHRARYLKPGEKLFNWDKWSIEHTFHFICGAYPWYRVFGLEHGIWGIFNWSATDFDKQVNTNKSGKIILEWNSVYFSHPEGKIRLKIRISTLQIMAALVIFFFFINLILIRLINPT
jgi:methionyl-tRNA formyltransferase